MPTVRAVYAVATVELYVEHKIEVLSAATGAIKFMLHECHVTVLFLSGIKDRIYSTT
jgi:hypothetical protein